MDWPALMRFGLGVLRMTPRDFWDMTPREFLAAAAPWTEEGDAPMGRAELDALRARFPDKAPDDKTPDGEAPQSEARS